MEKIFYPQQPLIHAQSALPDGKAWLNSIGDKNTKFISNSSFEFRELRQYNQSDPLKNIHWKSSARTGNLMVKTFFEEQKKDFIFIIENSFQMLSGITQPLLQKAIDLTFFSQKQCLKEGSRFFTIYNQEQKPVKLTKPQHSSLIQDLYSPKKIESDWELQKLIDNLKHLSNKKINIIFFTSGFWAFNPHGLLLKKLNAVTNIHKFYIKPLFALDDMPATGIYYFNDPLLGTTCEIDFAHPPALAHINKQKEEWLNKIKKTCQKVGIKTL